MIKKIHPNTLTALCTAAALIALAFYQRYRGPVPVSAGAFFVAAAVLCLLPSVYALVRCQAARAKPKP